MNTQNLKQSVVKMNCALALNKRIVGIKFLFTELDYEAADVERVKKRMHYCVMVKAAMSGTGFKATGDDLTCLGGARATGLKEADDYNKSGQHSKQLGLYRDMATAKSVRDGVSICDHHAYGIMVKPLEYYSQEPDVVMMVSNPYNIMRVLQGYSYYYGLQSNFKMTGNQAICSEVTAAPYLTNDINVSMMCIGTRHEAGWKDDELAVAFPYNRFETITKGVMETVNIMDNNDKKKVIEEKINKNNIQELKIQYNHNYYDDIPML